MEVGGTAIKRPVTATSAVPLGGFHWATVHSFPARDIGDIKAFDVRGDVCCFSARGKGLTKWNAAEGTPLPFPAATEGLGALILTVSLVGNNLWAADSAGNVAIFDAYTGALVARPFSAHNGEVRCIMPEPSGNYVVTGGQDFQLRTWGPSGERLASSGHHKVGNGAMALDGALQLHAT